MMSFSKTVWILAGLCWLLLALLAAVLFYRSHYYAQKQRVTEVSHQLLAQREALSELQRQHQVVTEIDRKYTEELLAKNETIEQLRSDLAAGRQRLYVNAKCPKLLTYRSTAGLDPATRPQLAGDAEQNYLRLRQQVIQMQSQLEALQAYFINLNRKESTK